ncbi:MAG: hypothetical protein O7C59_12110, partial [Rickettsia endosymbiont of Ixodes persulcatus]|nr:hypothetical protein [Rickettsia endosymbiont of Ixodes persulcatus]
MVKKNLFLTPPSLTEIPCPSISFLSLSLSFYLATSSATTCSRGMCLLHFHNVKLSLIACQVSSMIASCIAFASRIAFTWKKKKILDWVWSFSLFFTVFSSVSYNSH